MKKTVLILAALILGAGCTSTLQDLEGVQAVEPDSYEVFQSPDLFPNVARICIDGIAFVATTRDYQQVTPIPEWNKHCEGMR